jgi:hypothetical protein
MNVCERIAMDFIDMDENNEPIVTYCSMIIIDFIDSYRNYKYNRAIAGYSRKGWKWDRRQKGWDA